MRSRAATLAALLLAAAAAAGSQPVYRCGAAGNVYSAVPCQGGHKVRVADTRSAEQYEAARVVAQETHAHGLRLESARLQAEAASPPAQTLGAATPPSRVPPVEPEALTTSNKGRTGQRITGFRAVVPGSSVPSERLGTKPGAKPEKEPEQKPGRKRTAGNIDLTLRGSMGRPDTPTPR
jgi:hypothetical protein